MRDVTVSLTPVTSGACVFGCLVLGRDALGLLPRGRLRAPGFPDQLCGLCLQVAKKLVEDRFGNGLWGSEDRINDNCLLPVAPQNFCIKSP